MESALSALRMGTRATLTALSLSALIAGSALASGISVSFANSTPTAHLTTGVAIVSHGGAANSAWVRTRMDTPFDGQRSGAGAIGLRSTSVGYSGPTGGKINVTLTGVFTYDYRCSAFGFGTSSAELGVLVRIRNTTTGRNLPIRTLFRQHMHACKATPLTPEAAFSVTGKLPGAYTASFSGAGIVAGHKYHVVAYVLTSVGTVFNGAVAVRQDMSKLSARMSW